MAKMGRPKKKASERRDHPLTVRLTPGEYRELANIGKKLGITRREVAHRCITLGLEGVEILSMERRRKS